MTTAALAVLPSWLVNVIAVIGELLLSGTMLHRSLNDYGCPKNETNLESSKLLPR